MNCGRRCDVAGKKIRKLNFGRADTPVLKAESAGNPPERIPGAGRPGQYSDASMMVKTLTVWRGSVGSSLPFVMVVS
jgi:hypothetical protein